MKTKSIFTTTILAAALHCLQIPSARAEEPAKAEADSLAPLEKAVEQLARLDEEFAKRLDTTAAVVDAEAAAKRIPEINAQNLREILRTSGLTALERRMPMGVSPSVVMENVALKEAWRELEATAAQLRAKRAAVFNDVAKELRRRVSGAVLGRPKPEEIDALIQTIEKVQGSLQSKGAGNDPQVQWLNATNILRALKRLAAAESASAASALPAALKAFRSATGNFFRDVLGEEDAQTRINRIYEPIAKAADEKRAALDAMIEARKSADEISTAFGAYSEASERFFALRDGQSDDYTTQRNMPAFYRAVVNAFRSMESGDTAQGQEHLRQAASTAQQMSGGRGVKLEQMVTKLEKELAEKAAKIRQKRAGEIAARLVAVKEPGDLKLIAGEMQSWNSAARYRSGSETEDYSNFIQQLNNLAVAWSASNPTMLAQQEHMNGRAIAPLAFAKEYTALRDRIQRDMLARTLKAPELTKPPLAEQPMEAALETLCNGLAEKGEWRRLLQILELRPPLPAEGFIPQGTDTASTLRAFLTGQNFELGEQWADAVRSYKTVLRSTAERVPTKAAAERLKAIAKEHPEAFPKEAPEPGPTSLQKIPNDPAVQLCVSGFTN